MELVDWALRHFGERLAIVTAFQAEGLVTLDMAHQLGHQVRVITIDTGRLPQETYDLIDKVRRRYRIDIEMLTPKTESLQKMLRERGPNLFFNSPEDRHLCCRVRKVEPLQEVFHSLSSWVTGLRRDQAPSRAGTQLLERDESRGGATKINPLAAWSWDEVWSYIRTHNVPYNALYDRGYRTIGCAPWTRAVGPGEDDRAGRWWWEGDSPKECGLHLPILNNVELEPTETSDKTVEIVS